MQKNQSAILNNLIQQLDRTAKPNILSNKSNLPQKSKSTNFPKLEKQQLKEELRLQYKRKWRDAGYVNKEFSKVPILKAKILNNWEMERIYLSKRTYQYPQDFKGFKVLYNGSQFPQAETKQLPANTQKYIKAAEEKYKNNLFDTMKTIEGYDTKIEKIKTNHNKLFRVTNTAQNNSFGFNSVRSARFGSLQK